MIKGLTIAVALALVASPAYAKRVRYRAANSEGNTCTVTPDLPDQPGECWYKSPDGSYWTVTGRTEMPLAEKLNVLWWFGNDYDPVAPAWYAPTVAQPARNILWYLRNPLQNAGNYIAGTKDLNYTVRFVKGPAGVTSYNDIGQTGCIYTVLDNSHGGNLWWPRTYVSCTTKNLNWYAGTQWSGFWGLKFNILNSPIQFFARYHGRRHARKRG